MPRQPLTRPSTTGAASAEVRRLVAAINQLVEKRFRTPESRAQFEVFIGKFANIIDPTVIKDHTHVWLQDDVVFIQISIGTLELVLPGKRNPYASVTGNNLTNGGWGAPTDGQLECPKCNGDTFKYESGFAEAASNICTGCGYREDFIY